MELAAEPGVGEAPTRRPATRPCLPGGYRLPSHAGTGQASGPVSAPGLGLGPPPSAYFPGGADRDWENIFGTGVRAKGLPRRFHRLLRHRGAIVSRTGTGPGRTQPRAADARTGAGG